MSASAPGKKGKRSRSAPKENRGKKKNRRDWGESTVPGVCCRSPYQKPQTHSLTKEAKRAMIVRGEGRKGRTGRQTPGEKSGRVPVGTREKGGGDTRVFPDEEKKGRGGRRGNTVRSNRTAPTEPTC